MKNLFLHEDGFMDKWHQFFVIGKHVQDWDYNTKVFVKVHDNLGFY